jgi:hypothetical protein
MFIFIIKDVRDSREKVEAWGTSNQSDAISKIGEH